MSFHSSQSWFDISKLWLNDSNFLDVTSKSFGLWFIDCLIIPWCYAKFVMAIYYFTVIVQFSLVDNKLTQSDQISAKYLWKNWNKPRIGSLLKGKEGINFCFQVWLRFDFPQSGDPWNKPWYGKASPYSMYWTSGVSVRWETLRNSRYHWAWGRWPGMSATPTRSGTIEELFNDWSASLRRK